MRRFAGRTLWITFAGAIVLVVLTAVAADLTTARYASSEAYVSHSRQVETHLLELRADLLSAEAARLTYVVATDPEQLESYHRAVDDVPQDMEELDMLVADNPRQRARLATLRPLIEQRLGVLQESVELASRGVVDRVQQRHLTEAGGELMTPIREILDEADSDERALLAQRITISEKTYSWVRRILAMSFALSILILCAAFARLLTELRNRAQAEEAVRLLSGRLLKVQDDERRRIARELHDSLGQLLVSTKMNLDHLASLPEEARSSVANELIEASLALVGQSLDETRTLSYLLHPPLLDEFGFLSAAKWYVEGFSRRSKINVDFDIPGDLGRMPDEIELALFRVLQECLTNIHRHSGSVTAKVHVTRTSNQIFLGVRDTGKGMSPELLQKFRSTRASMGVGLSGMRERVRQLGGDFEIDSNSAGTIVNVRIPLQATGPSERSGGSPPDTQSPAQHASSGSTDSAATAGGSRRFSATA